MKEWLNLLVAQKNYMDNARYGVLINPETHEPLELDRFYPEGVGFEFNGQQHYGPTRKFSAQISAEQQKLDKIKAEKCPEHNITLVTITAEDLSFETMLAKAKVDHLLPLSDLRGYEPLIDFLENAGRRYRNLSKNWVAVEGNDSKSDQPLRPAVSGAPI
jgi:hypothetical protein